MSLPRDRHRVVCGAGIRLAVANVAPFVFAVAILVFAAEQGIVSRLLKTPAIAIVGLLSYSIYMTHQIIIAMVNNGVQIGAKLISRNAVGNWEADFFANPWWMDLVVVVFIAAMIAAAWCTYNLIEVPWRRRFNKIASGISPKREIVPLGVSLDTLRAELDSPPLFGGAQNKSAKTRKLRRRPPQISFCDFDPAS